MILQLKAPLYAYNGVLMILFYQKIRQARAQSSLLLLRHACPMWTSAIWTTIVSKTRNVAPMDATRSVSLLRKKVRLLQVDYWQVGSCQFICRGVVVW